jgi:hypothetical protein
MMIGIKIIIINHHWGVHRRWHLQPHKLQFSGICSYFVFTSATKGAAAEHSKTQIWYEMKWNDMIWYEMIIWFWKAEYVAWNSFDFCSPIWCNKSITPIMAITWLLQHAAPQPFSPDRPAPHADSVPQRVWRSGSPIAAAAHPTQTTESKE